MPQLISGQRGAGNTYEANQKKDIYSYMGLLDPFNTPVMQFAFFGKKKSRVVTNVKGKFSWMEDELYPTKTTTSANITALSGKLTLTTSNVGAINFFTADDYILIEDTDEMAFVESVSSSSVVLVKAGGGNLSNVATGTVIRVVITAFTEGSTAPDAVSTQEVEVYNYLTIMKRTIETTGRDQAGAHYTDGVSHAEQVQKTLKEMKIAFERYAMMSNAYGNAGAAGSLVKTYGKGFYGMISTNNGSYSTLTEAALDTFIEGVIAKGTPNRKFYVGSTLYFAIQKIIKAKYGTLPTNMIVKEYGVDVMKYKHGYANIDLVHNPILDGKFADGGVLLDEEKITGRHMDSDNTGSRKLRIEKNVQVPGTDGTKDLILSDIGIQYQNEQTAGWLLKT